MQATVPHDSNGRFQRSDTPNAQEDDFIRVSVDAKYGKLSGLVFRPVRNGQRRENYYVKFSVGGKTVFHGLGTSKPTGAVDVAKRKMRAALEDRWDALDASKLRQVKAAPLMGDIFEAYRARVREFNPQIEPATIGNVISAMRGVLRPVHGDKPAEEVRVTALNEELVEQFFAARVAQAGEDRVERDKKIRGANSTLRNARTLFSKAAMKCYRGIELPDLSGFLTCETLTNPKLRNPDLPDEVVWEIAQAALWLREQSPALYLVHLLFRHLGMRNDEIENARLEWIERRPTEVFLPNGERRAIGGFLAIVKRPYWEPKQSEGFVPIAPEVLAEIDRLSTGAPGDFLVPARTMTERAELVDRVHGHFVRPWLEKYPKKSYELRRWSATKVELRQGREFRDIFLRHADTSTGGRHYSTRQAVPAPISFLDCGLGPEDVHLVR